MRSLPTWVHLGWRETVNNRRFALYFAANLALGLVGFVTIDGFRGSIDQHLSSRSRAILGADLSISAVGDVAEEARSRAQQALGESLIAQSKEVGMVSMLGADSGSRLVEVRGISADFPLYGHIELKEGGKRTSETAKEVVDDKIIWLHPELFVQMEVQPGDRVRLGEAEFVVGDEVTYDASAAGAMGFTGLAPRVYVGLNHLADTELIQKGSRVYHSYLYKLVPGSDPEAAALKVREAIDLTDVRVTTHKTASRQIGRLLTYLNDYLGLVGLVALFLASVGAAYLFRSFLMQRGKDVAILMSLGLRPVDCQRMFAVQLALLGMLAACLSLAVTALLLPAVPALLGELMNLPLELAIRPRTFVLALLMGIGAAMLFCMPLLQRLRQLRPAQLFQEQHQHASGQVVQTVLGYLPALAVYWLLAVWQVKSLRLGSIFMALFLGAGVVLGLIAWLGLHFGSALRPRGLALRHAWLALTRGRVAAVSSFLAIALGAMLTNIIPQIKSVLAQELEQPAGEALPGLFLFDIQEDQVSGIQEALAEADTRIDYLSPLVRARLLRINGEDVEVEVRSEAGTREQQWERNFRNRTYNLSSRLEFVPSESLVSGEVFPGPYDWESGETPLISVEMRIAQRIGVAVGDTMTFDVQGIEVTGRVANTRRVKWTSFHPNFFVQFQPGVLDDAPKIFLGSVPNMGLDEKVALQNRIVKAFPNVTVIDVAQTVERIRGIVDQMSVAISVMASLSLLAGLAVLYSIASFQAHRRRRDMTLMKVLGARFGTVRAILMVEFAILGLTAAAFGAGVSVLCSGALSLFLFETPMTVDFVSLGTAFLAITVVCAMTGYIATRSVLWSRPVELLAEG